MKATPTTRGIFDPKWRDGTESCFSGAAIVLLSTVPSPIIVFLSE